GTNYPNPAYRNLKDHLIGKRKIPYQIPAKLPYTGHFQRWVDFEPEYKLYPGDQLDIVVSSAPEMSRTLTIGPDGRIVMPHIQPTMAAGRTFTELKGSLELQLASVLRDPTLAVTPRAYSPEQIYIGGEVTRQGTFTLSGPTGVLEAIIMSGGLLASAKSKQIAVLRRSPNGGMMMRTIDLKNGLKNIREYNDNMQLRRNDVIFVPRKDIAEIGIWVSNLRNALPINFSYQLGNNNGGFNGNITP
ncbi:MAG: polysaccharide biosynthesis/export family protein, partial [Maricaulaceae bacterium]